MAVFFGLVAAALGLGYWLNNHALGFLAITVILGILTLVIWRGRFHFVDLTDSSEDVENESKQLEDPSVEASKQIPPHPTD